MLDLFCATRMELIDLLLEAGEDAIRKHVTVNGVKLCPHTGTPYSVLYIIQEFIEHDNHHKAQSQHFLKLRAQCKAGAVHEEVFNEPAGDEIF
ncbi:hypothetical protein SAMN02799630_02319 [Paenibacillus sp. UNCCL117]|uniref:hypothetical protein n=1 Tax=unclassified Paenibacillus TaxID=185978 RepID=UPI00088553AE|nr:MULTISPECIES: hypothetical protein [unclassified Paenibacillus]SDD17443.1 hypothetical protein SAMN04488602_106195 [Paenibacillus sp. cl123]SFW34974.1 hypothetical protein SAMN02799630_02319 [Paenibacillus sp. UNCCL117]